MKRLVLISLLAVSLAGAQKQRLLVSPYNDVIPLKNGESAAQVVAKKTGVISAASCTNKQMYGFDPDHYPVQS